MSKRVMFLLEMVLNDTESVYNIADLLVGDARRISAGSAGTMQGLARIIGSSEPPRTHWDYSKQLYRWEDA